MRWAAKISKGTGSSRLAAGVVEAALWANELAPPSLEQRAAIDTVLPVVKIDLLLWRGRLILGFRRNVVSHE